MRLSLATEQKVNGLLAWRNSSLIELRVLAVCADHRVVLRCLDAEERAPTRAPEFVNIR